MYRQSGCSVRMRDPRQRRRTRATPVSSSTRPTGTISGWSDVASGLSNGAGRLFVYGTFDKPVTQSGKLNAGDRDSTGYVKFDTSSDKVVNLRIATSLMSIEQAKKNLQLEIRPTDTLTVARGARPEPVGRASSTPSRSRAPRRTRAGRSTRTSTGCRCIRTRRTRTSAPRPRPRWKHTVQSSTDSPPATRDRDRRRHRRRQGLRQQRLLGHVPDRLGGLRDVRPRHRGRAGRRLRPAVPRRRLDRALVLAGLREPDDRHELGRRVRRRLREGGQGLRRPRRLRRRGPERHRRAAGRRPERPERRPQGPGDVAVPRLHAVGGVRGRLVGARGLHQRLRHRQHGEGAGRPSERCRQAASARGVRVLPQPRHQLREHVRPGDRLLPGPLRQRSLEVLTRRVRPARVGPRARLHGDRWLELRVPRAAGRPGAREPLRRPGRARAQARRLLRHAGDRDVHGLLRRDDPRDARGPRRAHGSVGLLESGVAPHPVDVRVRQAAVEDRGEDARGAAPPVLRLRDRPGLRRRRGQR